jgi:hypothetical protein
VQDVHGPALLPETRSARTVPRVTGMPAPCIVPEPVGHQDLGEPPARGREVSRSSCEGSASQVPVNSVSVLVHDQLGVPALAAAHALEHDGVEVLPNVVLEDGTDLPGWALQER